MTYRKNLVQKHQGLSLVLLFALTSFFVQAQKVFVSTEGSDNSGNGSERKPYKSLWFANTKATKGDTIFLAKGTFVESKPCKIPAGVSIKGTGVGKTIIKSAYFHSVTFMDVAPDYYLLQVEGTDGAVFSEFTLDGDARKTHGGLSIHNSKNVQINDIVFKDINFCGLWLTNSEKINFHHSVIDNCAWPSTKSCSGALMIAELTDCEIHDVKIRDDRAYGIKTWAWTWRDNQPYKQPGFYQTPLKNVNFYNLDIIVEPVGAWANGQSSNFCMELWNGELYNCTIHDSYFNETISLPSEALHGQKVTLEVYNNAFIMSDKKGVPSYAIEAVCTNIHIHHNYFKGGNYPMSSFGPIVEGHRIHNNVFEDIWSGGIIHHRGVKDMEVYNNTIYSKNDLPIVDIGPRHAQGLTIRNNVFYAWNKPVTKALLNHNDTVRRVNVIIKDNWFYNWKPEGLNAKTGQPMLELKGQKPTEFFRPTVKSPLRKNKTGALIN